MILESILAYDNIVIQCHDDPDADAVASGYALLKYLDSKGKTSRLVYGGKRQIGKRSLLLMIEKLGIPLKYLPIPEDHNVVIGQDALQYHQSLPPS